MLDNAFMDEVVRVAYDEVQRLCNIDLHDDFASDTTLNTHLVLTLVQAMTASALICYHNALRDKLLTKGIDIGSPMIDLDDE